MANMELKEFVSNSIVQIIEGVKEAQDKAGQFGAIVNPTNLFLYSGQTGTAGQTLEDNNVSRLVEFDIAVTSVEGEKTKGGLGVVVGVLSAGTMGQSEAQNSSVSRIKFSVPILFPGTPAEKKREQQTSCKTKYDLFNR